MPITRVAIIPTSTLMITMEYQISAIVNVLEMGCVSEFGLPKDTNELQQCNGGTEIESGSA